MHPLLGGFSKIAVIGSRGYPYSNDVRRYVRDLGSNVTLVSGGCPNSPDQWAEDEALRVGMSVISFRPINCGFEDGYRIMKVMTVAGSEIIEVMDEYGPFKNYGQAAFFRNSLIAQECNHMAAFWDGKSNGTANAIEHGRRLDRAVIVYGVDED